MLPPIDSHLTQEREKVKTRAAVPFIEGKVMQVRGDVFVARTFDNEDDFKRLDFTLSEVSSRAAWVKEARAQNERKAKVDLPIEQPVRMRLPSRG